MDTVIVPAPTFTVTAPQSIPVNANDDNGSPWVAGQPGIPTVRDYDITTPTKYADPQLIAVSVTINNPGDLGILTLDTYCPGEATISLWQDQQKTLPFSIAGVTPANNVITFYVEGTHQSSTTADFAYINLIYSNTNNQTVTNQIKILVTPILLSYVGTTPNVVTFINGINGLQGLQAKNPAGAIGQVDGISLTADVQNSSCEFMNFIQNATGDTNGANNGTGDGGLWLNGGANIYDLIPNTGLNFPFLDSPQGNAPGNPYMPVAQLPDLTGGDYYSTADSPQLQMGNPAYSATISTIDLGESYSTYLVVRYADNSIYPIACLNWSVNFYATNWVQNQGVTFINPASGVSVGNSFSVWDASGLMTGGPTAVQATHWEEVT